MRRPSRRSALAVTAIAALGTGGALSSVASATAAPAQSRLALPDLSGVTNALGLPATSSPLTVVNSILATVPASGTLTDLQAEQLLTAITTDPTSLPSLLQTGIPIPVLGQLLASDNPNLDQLSALLDALSQGDVAAALATLTPAQQQKAQGNMTAAKQQQVAKLQPKPAAAKQTFFTAYRATVTSIRVSKNRRKASIKVTCPASSPKGCYVQVFPKVGGKKAGSMKAFLLARNTTQSGSISLSSSAAKRLKKGGSVQMTAKTALSSLSSATKTVKVAKTKSKSK